jgi:3-methylfumaryl-CoA hydratase
MNEIKLQQWIGRNETVDDIIGLTPARALAATFNRQTEILAQSQLPALWHWLYFLETAAQQDLAPDGHRQRGGFLPPITLPRRMWAGSQLQFHLPVNIGDPLTRSSTIHSIKEKTGRSGSLVFVKVQHEISRSGQLCITESQDIVYREAAKPGASLPAGEPADSVSNFQLQFQADSRLLFRYSALTFNAHRIHYDTPYVTEVEGYPGLIVHGPLLATMMLELLWQNLPEAQLSTFEFKALRPVFDNQACTIRATSPDSEGNVRLWIADHEGALCMQGQANIRP